MKSLCTPDASVNRTENGWQLVIPGGDQGTYRVAQLYDYGTMSRGCFPQSPPRTLSLRARVSSTSLPGTWGFGLWNDPFGLSLGFGGTAGRLPILPNSAWFFHASKPNWLAISDKVPANGFFAGTIQSPRIPSLILAPTLLFLPFLLFKPISRLLRRFTSRIVHQESTAISADEIQWHKYSLTWLRESIEFKIDGESIMQTHISPLSPLGLVIWIDNQYAAWTPEGRLGYGTLANPTAWLEIDSYVII